MKLNNRFSISEVSVPDTCDLAVDLQSISSPYSGTTTDSRNDYILQCGQSWLPQGPESIFYLDMYPGDLLKIRQTSNPYGGTQRQLAYGGACPGTTLIECIDGTGTSWISWTNELDDVERVYFMIDSHSTIDRSTAPGYGSFTLEWDILKGNKF